MEIQNGSTDKPNIPAPDEFKTVVEESKKTITEAGQPPPKITRGRGRPRKDGSAPSQAAPNPQNTAPPPGAMPTPPPDLTQMFIMPVAIVGEIPARRTGIRELALTENEAVAIAQSLNGILQAFIPDLNRMSPKTAAIFTFGITVGSVALSKYAVYAEHVAKNVGKPVERVDKKMKVVETIEQPVQSDGDAPPMPPGGVSAMDVMRRER